MAREKRKPKKKIKVNDKKDSDAETPPDSPDVNAEDFFEDDVDKFHSNREKIFLEKSSFTSDEESVGEEQFEEVLGLDVKSESDEEEFNDQFDEGLSDSDDDMEKGAKIPSEKAWGKKKTVYYDAEQYKEKDLDSEQEEMLEKEEENEALMLQHALADRLDENDFDLKEFEEETIGQITKQAKESEKNLEHEKIVMDLSRLSKDEKIKLLAKNSPEMFELIKDFKEKLFEVTEKVYPLVKMARTEKIANPKGLEYLEMKYQLMLNYLVNICFYLLLKAHQIPVLNHPVIKRLVEYRELLQQLKPLDSKLEEDIKYFLDENTQDKDEHEDNVLLQNKKAKDSERKKPSKKIVHFSYSDVEPETDGKSEKGKRLEDFDPMSYYETMSEMKIKKKEKRKRIRELKMNPNDHGFLDDEAINTDTDGKRGISYQISKNKGLTPKRKKEVRNPRLKHRKKFVKAKIKRKSRINPVVKELSRYGGESTGIKSHLTRSVKIK